MYTCRLSLCIFCPRNRSCVYANDELYVFCAFAELEGYSI